MGIVTITQYPCHCYRSIVVILGKSNYIFPR